jgi:hypothetical protein
VSVTGINPEEVTRASQIILGQVPAQENVSQQLGGLAMEIQTHLQGQALPIAQENFERLRQQSNVLGQLMDALQADLGQTSNIGVNTDMDAASNQRSAEVPTIAADSSVTAGMA